MATPPTSTSPHPAPTATAAAPPTDAWKTLQHAADQVTAGDTVWTLPGTYAGFNLFTSGAAGSPITFRAIDSDDGPNPQVVIDQNNGFTHQDLINLEGASYVRVEGFTLVGTGHPATNRACIRVVGSASAPARYVEVRRNACDRGGRWGIFTGFAEDFTAEDNVTSNSADEHGIYVSNSGDRPVIRGNLIFGNHSNGIHMNGDASLGGDGVISGALVERNVLLDNGDGDPTFGPPGGSGINADGVVDSVFRNNLLYDNHKSGISLYRIDGGAPSTGNLVVNNTVWMASDARWALNIQDGSTGNEVRNNVLLNDHPFRGAIDISSSSLPILSDHNVVKDRFSIDGNFIDLAAWQAQTGQDAASAISTPGATFADAAGFDLDLHPGSPALDAGTSTPAPADDLRGKPRPFGDGFDVGAYELGSCLGSATGYGTPLPGAGTPTVTLSGCPDIDDVATLAIDPDVPGAPSGLLLLGVAPAQVATLGGTLLVNPALSIPLSGAWSGDVTMPDSAPLVGASIYLQAWYVDPGAPFQVAMSAGLHVVVGG